MKALIAALVAVLIAVVGLLAYVEPYRGSVPEDPTHMENADESSAGAVAAKRNPPHAKNDGTVRILCVGNSWTSRSVKYLCSIANSAGKKVVIGHAFLRASSLQEQYFGLLGTGKKFTYQGETRKVRTSYTYHKYVNSDTYKATGNSTLEYAIKDEPWDYLVLQNRAPESGNYAVWDKHSDRNEDVLISKDSTGKRRYVHFDVNDFVDLIKSKMAPDVSKKLKVGLSAVWSYAEGQDGGVADSIQEYIWANISWGEPHDQWGWDAVYERLDRDIQKTMRRVKSYMDGRCDFIVNPGLAFRYARADEELSEFGYDLHTSDTNAHPAPGLPCYLAGLTYAYAILGIQWDDVRFYPDVSSKSYYYYDFFDFETWNKRLTPRLALRAVACAWHAQTGKRIDVSNMHVEAVTATTAKGKRRLGNVRVVSPTFGRLERGVDYRLEKRGSTATVRGCGQFSGDASFDFGAGKTS